METLNQIAENIAYKLGDQFNFTLRESIKDSIIYYRAKYIRDDADRNFISEIHFAQVLTLQFQVVNLLNEFGADFSCISAICEDVQLQDKYNILKSKKPIPLPIRLKSMGRSPYMYLGKVDGSRNFSYTTLDKYPYFRTLKYSSKNIFFVIINGYLYIINNLTECDINESLKLCNVMLKGIFENPRDIYNACTNSDVFMDDMPFPISKDMLMQISNGILKGEYPLKAKDGEQVNLAPDDNE